MHETVKNLINIQNEVNQNFPKNEKRPTIIAVSKTFQIDHINHLINHGHKDFGENKVQEAIEKWSIVKEKNENIKLHLIGKLQTNKVKLALKIFDYIHSLDNEKLAKKISDFQAEKDISTKIFIQVNIGDEEQKSGIKKTQLIEFYNYCISLNLDIIGLMCIPPFEKNSDIFFEEMNTLKNKLKLNNLSMGMSSDYISAISYESTYLRIGSNIFGKRS